VLIQAGISFLYAIWHSPHVRSKLSLDDVDFTVLAGSSVLGDLATKCPPAESCREAFLRMSKTTIAMVEKTTGFGNKSTLSSQPLRSPEAYAGSTAPQTVSGDDGGSKWTNRIFDMDLTDLLNGDQFASSSDLTTEAQNMPQQSSWSTGSKPTTSASVADQELTTAPLSTTSPIQTQFQQPNAMDQQTDYFTMETLSQPPASAVYDDMAFLDTFSTTDSLTSDWTTGGGGMYDLDLGFTTGSTGCYDVNGEWDPNGIDMFGGFFFGNE
jgi:hypothetical protein